MESPFSLKHHWKVKWNNQNNKVHESAMIWNGKIEKDLLPALANVGVIGHLQMKHIFLGKGKKSVSKLCSTGKLTRHILLRNKEEIPIFTLGPTSEEMLKDKMPIVEWRTFSIQDILQRLLFFQLINKLREDKSNISIFPSAYPFVAGIIRNGRKIHVLVERGNEKELIHTFKFYPPKEQFIFIKEKLNYGQELDQYMEKCKVRLTTDNDMKMPFHEMFYRLKNGQWIKESHFITPSYSQKEQVLIKLK